MKLTRFFAVVSCMLTLLCSCGGPDAPDVPDKPDQPDTPVVPDPDEPTYTSTDPIFTNFSSLGFGPGEEELKVHVYGAKGWDLTNNNSWIEANKEGDYLNIKVLPLGSASQRVGNISLKSLDSGKQYSISVRQNSTLGGGSSEFKSEGQKLLFLTFTATWCPYSPVMHDAVKTFRSYHEDLDFEEVYIHVGESNLVFENYQRLSAAYNDNNNVPHLYISNAGDVSGVVGSSSNMASRINNLYLNLKNSNCLDTKISQANAKVTGNIQDLNIELNIVPKVTGKYRIQAWILEDNIIGYQFDTNVGDIPEYRHNSVLRKSVSELLGNELSANAGDPISLSFKTALPEGVDASSARLLLIIQREYTAEGMQHYNGAWYVDNCFSLPLGEYIGANGNEDIITDSDF